MKGIKILAVVLVVTGGLELVYGNFSYADETRDIGMIQSVMVLENQHLFNASLWLGAGALVLGSMILLVLGIRRMQLDARLRYY